MVALPSRDELLDFARESGLPDSMPRASLVEAFLAAERKAKMPARALGSYLDADAFAAGLRALQDAADAAGVRRDVLVAAVPAAARIILSNSLHDPKELR